MAAVAAVALIPSGRAMLAQPPAAGNLAPELAAVPADAALFVHVDVAALWNSPVVKSIRNADAKTFADLSNSANALFGVTPDALRTATLFIPKIQDPEDAKKFALTLTFNKAADRAKLKAGIEQAVPKDAQAKLLMPDNTTAVVLFGLGDQWAKPAGKPGPLGDAIRAAATGKHAVVVGSSLASLPDEVRGDNLPEFVRPFAPILKSDAVVGTLDLGKDFTFHVRVKAKTPAQAASAEKALGALGEHLQEGVAFGIKDLGKDDGLKDIVTLMKAVQDGFKNAAYAKENNDASMTWKIPADLPFVKAWTDGTAKVKAAAEAARSSNNLKQIALAMHNYHDTHGAFPPAAVCDKTGKPMLSWRVLILPYIEQDALYKQFKLDEPWDSDHNKKLLAKMPATYSLPDKKPVGTDTHYRVFVGNGAGFDYIQGVKIFNISDGTSNTFMVATAADAVPWTKPDEIAFDPMKDMSKLLGTQIQGKVQVAFFDGSVRMFKKMPSKENLNAYITRAGGEVIAIDD